jgi:hypothetical protein
MKEIPEYEKDLASIRAMMERSVKFVSLSGLSGVLAGIYALLGAATAYYLIYFPNSPFGFHFSYLDNSETLINLLLVAAFVLVASLLTGYTLSTKKARKLGVNIWNNASRQLLLDLSIPLTTGGIFMLILILQGYFTTLAATCLLFYGVALTNASRHTFKEVMYLGICEILLGLTAAFLPGYGLIFWALGFGVLHIIYGAFMHYRYDQ